MILVPQCDGTAHSEARFTKSFSMSRLLLNFSKALLGFQHIFPDHKEY